MKENFKKENFIEVKDHHISKKLEGAPYSPLTKKEWFQVIGFLLLIPFGVFFILAGVSAFDGKIWDMFTIPEGYYTLWGGNLIVFGLGMLWYYIKLPLGSEWKIVFSMFLYSFSLFWVKFFTIGIKEWEIKFMHFMIFIILFIFTLLTDMFFTGLWEEGKKIKIEKNKK